MFRVGLLLLSCFLFPYHLLFASVSISEVAWMGSSESYNYEWIELLNNGSAVSLEGWELTDGTNLSIPLSGDISANSYVVLERNRSDGGSVANPPLLIYTGALVNTGATLTLRDSGGSTVDQVAGGENWQNIGGDNITKDTAQYTQSGWITAPPTPGRANSTTASPSPAPSVSPQNISKLTLEGQVTTKAPEATVAREPLTLSLSVPSLVYVGQPITFTPVVTGMTSTIRNSLHYQWNFGDLNIATSSKPTHTYQYPGTYNVVAEATLGKLSNTVKREVAVLPVTITLAHSTAGDILLQNNALYELDISGYRLTAQKSKVVPPRTFISPRETLTIPWQTVGQSAFPVTYLFGSNQQLIASTYSPLGGETNVPPTALLSKVITTSVPITSAKESPSGGANETATITPAPNFGFANQVFTEQSNTGPNNSPASAEASSTEDTATSTNPNNQKIIPLISSLTSTSTNPTPSSPLIWLVYLAFTLVLIITITTVLFHPKTTPSPRKE